MLFVLYIQLILLGQEKKWAGEEGRDGKTQGLVRAVTAWCW
jgi:hypothetical protein